MRSNWAFPKKKAEIDGWSRAGPVERSPMRTFVIADAHGYPELIQNALDHGGFQPGQDAFVFAGDLLDRGPDVEGCIALVETHATEVLLGNHDVPVLLDLELYPQDPESPTFQPFLWEKVLQADRSNAWKVATCVEGVLITHAGVSEEYRQVFEGQCQADPARLADHLNTVFLALVEREPRVSEWDDKGILSEDGPFWFRPRPYSHLLPLAGCVQVVGHTPPISGLEASGFYMVDPCAFAGMDDLRRYRYGVIEDARIWIEEGTLPGASFALRSKGLASAICE